MDQEHSLSQDHAHTADAVTSAQSHTLEPQEAFIAGWEACDHKWEGPSAAGYPTDVDTAWELYELSRPANPPSNDLLEALTELVLYHDVPEKAQDPVVVPLLRNAFAALRKAGA